MKSFTVLLGGSLLCLTAHAANPAASPPPNLHELMKNIVAVQAQVIWDVGNDAQDDNGNPDASKLKAADWAKLIGAAGKVKQASQKLATADHVLAAGPGQKIDGEGATPEAFGARQVQGVIDAKPQVFKAFAVALSTSMDQVLAAGQAKDAAKLFDVSGRLDQVCEDCHLQFWYPNQKTPK